MPLKYDGAGNIVPSDLQANPPNLPMFKLGTVPFLGDYIDVAAAPATVADAAGGWRFNVGAGSIPPVFHVAWTDNRDVRAPFDGQWTPNTPPDYLGLRPNPGPGVACVPGRAGARNQNIYTAPITDGLRVGRTSGLIQPERSRFPTPPGSVRTSRRRRTALAAYCPVRAI